MGSILGHGSRDILYRLFGFSTLMLLFGYVGETSLMDPILAFGIGLIFWALIIYEIFSGKAAKAASNSSNKALQSTFHALRLFVLIGWTIYPLGYYLGTINADELLNVAYNIADIINKIGFSFVIYLLARKDSKLHH